MSCFLADNDLGADASAPSDAPKGRLPVALATTCADGEQYPSHSALGDSGTLVAEQFPGNASLVVRGCLDAEPVSALSS